jgi:hypothetical protein
MSKRRKPYDQMTTEELREATAEFDREHVGVPGRPLTPAQRRTHTRAAAQARTKLGRPRKGEGAETVAVSVERGLLKRADAAAKRRKIGRSQLFTEALQALLVGKEAAQVNTRKTKPHEQVMSRKVG